MTDHSHTVHNIHKLSAIKTRKSSQRPQPLPGARNAACSPAMGHIYSVSQKKIPSPEIF